MGELTILGALNNAANRKNLTPVASVRGWRRIISEPYAGAWQQNEELKVTDLTCYPTLYACLNRISQDIGKLPFLLKREDENGIWKPVENPAYSPVLRKPNNYQTAQQFREAWILSKLITGNAFILKQRDNRGVVVAMYVLDPCRVLTMVSESGAVFYQINYPSPHNLLPANYPAEQLTVPASEVLHDRLNCFHHQLVGVPPLCAAYWPAVKNLKILKSSADFFSNNAQPGGILTTPAGMSDEDAEAIQTFWSTAYSGVNAGRVAVIGADMKFTPFEWGKSADSQLVEQMKYSDEQIAQPFGIPPFKIGIGAIPAGLGVDAINLLYMEDALHGHIMAMEALLTEGLNVAPYKIGLPEIELMRMDHNRKAEYHGTLMDRGIEAPNEARWHFGLDPLEGGGTVYMQQQDFPLDQVRLNRIVQPTDPPAAPPVDDDETDEQIERGLRAITALNTIKAIEAVRSEVFR